MPVTSDVLIRSVPRLYVVLFDPILTPPYGKLNCGDGPWGLPDKKGLLQVLFIFVLMLSYVVWSLSWPLRDPAHIAVALLIRYHKYIHHVPAYNRGLICTRRLDDILFNNI